MSEKKPRRRHADDLFVLSPCLLGFAVRLWAAGGPDLGLDGGLSTALALLPLSDSLNFLAHDVHPPLYYLLLRLWLALVGTTPLGVKYLGVLVGTLAVAVLLGWVRSLVGTRAAIVVGTLGAFAPAWVTADVTVREYGLTILLLTALAWVYTRPSATSRPVLIVLGVIALWTSFLAVFVPLIIGLISLVRRDFQRLRSVVLIGFGLVPWLLFACLNGFIATLQSSGPRQGPAAADPFLIQARDFLVFLTGGPTLAPMWLGPVLAGAAILLLVGITCWSGAFERVHLLGHQGFLVGSIIVGFLTAVSVNTVWTRQGLGIRFVSLLMPFVLAELGVVLRSSLKRALLPAIVSAALVGIPGVLGIVAWSERSAPPPSYWDPETLVQYLDRSVQPDDAIVFVWPEQAGYYQVLSRHPRRWVLLPAGVDYLQGDAAAHARQILPKLAPQNRVIWLVLYRQVLGTGTAQIGDWLSLNAYATNAADLPDSDVVPYLTRTPPAPSVRLNADFEGGIRLLNADWPEAIQPGAPLAVDLQWSGDGDMDRNLRVFVHLVDSTGRTVVQHDGVPENARAPVPNWSDGQVVDDRHGLLLPRSVAPGTYWLDVGLYDNSGRLPLLSGGNMLHLGPIVVRMSGPTRNRS